MSNRYRTLLAVLIALAGLIGCTGGPSTAATRTLAEQAAVEATAIVQRAEATAMILQAQARATALIHQAGQQIVGSTPTPTPPAAKVIHSATPSATSRPVMTSTVVPAAKTQPADLAEVELMGVGFAAEGLFLHIQFRAPPAVARQWRQGNVYLIDEATGTLYNEVPVEPLIGPLIGRPNHAGQIGYVMLVNPDFGIKSGSIVTVVLGNFKQEHIHVGH